MHLKDDQGNNLLIFSSFLSKPKFIEFFIDEIDPNETNNKGTNSLTMLIGGITQEYPFVFYDNYKIQTKNKKSFEAYKKKIENNIIKSVDILKKIMQNANMLKTKNTQLLLFLEII